MQMKKSMEDAIEIGVRAYQKFEYSAREKNIYRYTCQQFSGYLRQNHLRYSKRQAEQWVRAHKDFNSPVKWRRKYVVSMMRALEVMDNIMRGGNVTWSLRSLEERMPAYEKLPSWSKEMLDTYLGTLSALYAPNTLRLNREACARFLLLFEKAGIHQCSEITAEAVSSIFSADTRPSLAAQKASRHYVETFLSYWIDQKQLPEQVRLTYMAVTNPKTPLITNIDERFRLGFDGLRDSTDPAAISLMEYTEAGARLLHIIKERHYSAGRLYTIKRALHTFRTFLQVNAMPYSHSAALEWLAHLKTVTPGRGVYNEYRRALLSVHEVLTTGDLTTRVFSSRPSKYPILDWQASLLKTYLIFRGQEECAVSTQRTIRASCSRFFCFLNREGVETLREITPELLKQYHLQGQHSTARSRNLYASQLRLFLRYLGSQGLVPEMLEKAVSCQSAPNTKVVSVLSPEQTGAIYSRNETANLPMELRDAAFLLLGLRMGFRHADILCLKYSDISWSERTISIVQKKTGVFLKLPMPVDVGNSLYRYIQYGRPKQADCAYVFVRHQAPFDELTQNSGVGKRLKDLTLQASASEPVGFHITRRTFASNLLKSGSTVPVIASALGHADFANVDKYLSTDEARLRQCAIGLNGIEYAGRYKL